MASSSQAREYNHSRSSSRRSSISKAYGNSSQMRKPPHQRTASCTKTNSTSTYGSTQPQYDYSTGSPGNNRTTQPTSPSLYTTEIPSLSNNGRPTPQALQFSSSSLRETSSESLFRGNPYPEHTYTSFSTLETPPSAYGNAHPSWSLNPPDRSPYPFSLEHEPSLLNLSPQHVYVPNLIPSTPGPSRATTGRARFHCRKHGSRREPVYIVRESQQQNLWDDSVRRFVEDGRDDDESGEDILQTEAEESQKTHIKKRRKHT